ncbi:MAG: hypothetical protein PHP35_00515 [Candidatus Colwellbacteria bacterium]|nr:hypothetical protein [Candidatus Colwellbacteria bacterium]
MSAKPNREKQPSALVRCIIRLLPAFVFILCFIVILLTTILPEQSKMNAYVARKPEILREIRTVQTIEEIRIITKSCLDDDCRNPAFDKWLELISNKDEAKELFEACMSYSYDYDRETDAFERWVCYCETAKDAEDAYDRAYELKDHRWKDIAINKWLDLVSTVEEAKDLFDNTYDTELRKKIFMKIVEFCKTPEEAEEAFFMADTFSSKPLFDPPKLNEFELAALEKMFQLRESAAS